MDFRSLASLRQNFTRTKYRQEKAKTRSNNGYIAAVSSGCTNDIKQCWGTVFHMRTQQENIREGNFCFPKYSIRGQNQLKT